MKNFITILILMFFSLVTFTSCETDDTTPKAVEENSDESLSTLQLKFLDEFVYPTNQTFQNTKIGGLSGIDYDNGVYYVVSDDFNKPRYYKVNIDIKNNEISNVSFTDVVVFDKKQHYYGSNFLDLESIVFQNGNVVISSEGSIYGNKKPSIFNSNTQGDYVSEYIIPNHFLNSSRHNGVFESLTKSVNNQGIWSANELPLKVDDVEVMYSTTHSPLRLTYYENNSRKAIKEYIYELSPLPLPKQKSGDMNGISDILEYKENQFLIIERAFQNENIVKIFKATIESNTTNCLKIDKLKSVDYVPMKKELIFDFESIKSQLTNQKIDNVEGITFGEVLPNGNRSIIMISDDNFQKFGSQLNQFLLFELIEK